MWLYSFESPPQQLPAAHQQVFQARPQAWAFFQAQAPWYRRSAVHWVLRAKQEATRLRRLKLLVLDSAHGRRLKMLSRKPKPAGSRPQKQTKRTQS